ncbi:hemerythrin domain-containing protein [Umezawaea endophytica]|uniref:Hemerythrin domain-containing protein n=1 Tax=Umezawaea endophytica TaxID=1654476 RepID=A0A9X3AFJ9_9PSEU|nr:hemerythrin domain-containing protein [Umezawaea endophytica]MCS7477300.1 hemerythrin domain-containing protein [Umezawaea endophytica]
MVESEGLLMYDELIAVHTIMRRGADLTTASLERLVAGEPVGVKAVVRLARWQAEFVHHHHESEDELFWPVLRTLFPDVVAGLDGLSAEHEKLDHELRALSVAIDTLAEKDVDVREAAGAALPAATSVRDVLIGHLDAEEPVLKGLFPRVPDADIVRLRKAIVDGAPRGGPDLVIGLLSEPVPAPGHDVMMANFPAPVRLLRPLLLRRFHSTLGALAAR